MWIPAISMATSALAVLSEDEEVDLRDLLARAFQAMDASVFWSQIPVADHRDLEIEINAHIVSAIVPSLSEATHEEVILALDPWIEVACKHDERLAAGTLILKLSKAIEERLAGATDLRDLQRKIFESRAFLIARSLVVHKNFARSLTPTRKRFPFFPERPGLTVLREGHLGDVATPVFSSSAKSLRFTSEKVLSLEHAVVVEHVTEDILDDDAVRQLASKWDYQAAPPSREAAICSMVSWSDDEILFCVLQARDPWHTFISKLPEGILR